MSTKHDIDQWTQGVQSIRNRHNDWFFLPLFCFYWRLGLHPFSHTIVGDVLWGH